MSVSDVTCEGSSFAQMDVESRRSIDDNSHDGDIHLSNVMRFLDELVGHVNQDPALFCPAQTRPHSSFICLKKRKAYKGSFFLTSVSPHGRQTCLQSFSS